MSQKKDELNQIVRLTAGAIMMAVVDRVKNQEEEAYKVLDLFEDLETAGKPNTLGRAIVNTAGNPKTNAMLIYRIKKLTKQLNRRYQLPELTLSMMTDTTSEYYSAIGGQFGGWERILQAVTIEILQKTHILSDNAVLPEGIMKMLKKIKNNDEDFLN